jgi:hypothetical protein
MAAQRVLREAIECAEGFGHDIPAAWAAVRDGLQLRLGSRNGAVMSHDGYHPNEEKGATPGPLFGLFPFWHRLDAATQQATLEYYIDLAPGYIGSPMLSPLYGVWAAWAGDRRASERLFRAGYADLITGRFHQTLEQTKAREPAKPKAGPFFANLGGFLMGLLFGLPKISIGPGEPETWPQGTVTLPAGWRSIEVERLWVRRQPARLVAAHGALAEIAVSGSAGGGRRRRLA